MQQLPNGNIHVQWEHLANQYSLTVRDNGEGIKPEILPHIFERGVSGGGSTGLGLAIVKNVMDMHSGEVKITSETGKGTTVQLLFPEGNLAPSGARRQIPAGEMI